MTNTSKPNENPREPPPPDGRPTPKRGAFPTPKSEIEKAKPFVPDINRTDDGSETKHKPPADVDEKKNG